MGISVSILLSFVSEDDVNPHASHKSPKRSFAAYFMQNACLEIKLFNLNFKRYRYEFCNYHIDMCTTRITQITKFFFAGNSI